MWKTIKAKLLEISTAKIIGDTEGYDSRSTAGPNVGGSGSVFFNPNLGDDSPFQRRVRLTISDESPVTIHHYGDGVAKLCFDDVEMEGTLEPVNGHCPKQAYINISGSCIFRCRYCQVSKHVAHRKSTEEILEIIKYTPDVEAISLTSGVAVSPEEEEERVLSAVSAIINYSSVCTSYIDSVTPIGVSIYPVQGTAQRLFDAGVTEVKFNIETATPRLFQKTCPGKSLKVINSELDAAVSLFGINHVFSNIIFGLGETDKQLETAIDSLCARGIIPTLRALNPSGTLRYYERPTHERMLKVYEYLKKALIKNGLDTTEAKTMCIPCGGCDIIPGID